MRLYMSVVFFLLLSPGVWAQNIVVRGGDHPTFTRLTLTLPERADWQLRNQGRSFEVAIEGISQPLDLALVFNRISRERVKNVSAKKGALHVTLGCECAVKARRDAKGLLIIDIADRTGNWAQRQRLGRFVRQRAYAFSPAYLEDDRNMPIRSQIHTSRNFGSEQSTLSKPSPKRSEPQLPPATLLGHPLSSGQTELFNRIATSLENANQHDAHVVAAEKRLIEQFSHAMDIGLLVPRSPFSMRRADTKKTSGDDFSATPQIRREIQLAATFPGSSTMSEVHDPITAPQFGHSCIPDAQLEISNWSQGVNFSAEISERRRDLFGEFDRLDHSAAFDLVRAYISYGFGAEAQQILRFPNLDPEVSELLTDLAEVIENPGQASDTFAGQESCATDIALWSVLSAKDDLESARKSDRATVLRAFGHLPDPLQRRFADLLIETYRQIGDVTTADALAQMRGRAGASTEVNHSLALARLAQDLGNQDAFNTMTDAALRANSRDAPEVLIAQVDAAWEGRHGVAPELPDLLAAFRTEHRNSPLFATLDRAHLRAVLLAGRFDQAFEVLFDPGEGARPSETMASALALVAQNADDLDVLRFTLATPDSILLSLPTDIRDQVLQRVETLGFSELARRIYEAEPRLSSLDAAAPKATAEPSEGGPIASNDARVEIAEHAVSLQVSKTMLSQSAELRSHIAELLSN